MCKCQTEKANFLVEVWCTQVESWAAISGGILLLVLFDEFFHTCVFWNRGVVTLDYLPLGKLHLAATTGTNLCNAAKWRGYIGPIILNHTVIANKCATTGCIYVNQFHKVACLEVQEEHTIMYQGKTKDLQEQVRGKPVFDRSSFFKICKFNGAGWQVIHNTTIKVPKMWQCHYRSTHTQRDIVPLNTLPARLHPHAYILEAIKYANPSSPILQRGRLSQGPVIRTHAQTTGHSETQLPLGYLITLKKKLWCNNL